MKYFKEALNTVQASWLDIQHAKLFGKKSTHSEDGIVVTVYKYRGKVYLVDVDRTEESDSD